MENKEKSLLFDSFYQRAVYHTNNREWKRFLREIRYQKMKRNAMRTTRERKSITVNVKGIENLLKGKF